jgi:hypothetical protein
MKALIEEHFIRFEACGNFCRNFPPLKTGRSTHYPISQLQELIWKLVQDWPLLGSDDPEQLILKIECANQAINERVV